jgi:hypothetical protein
MNPKCVARVVIACAAFALPGRTAHAQCTPITTAPAAPAVQGFCPPFLAWTAIPSATSYDLYTAPTGDLSTATLLAHTAGTTFILNTPADLVGQTVWVRAANACSQGPFSEPATIGPAAPARITQATIGSPNCAAITVFVSGTVNQVIVSFQLIDQQGAVTADLGFIQPVSTASSIVLSRPIPGATSGQAVRARVSLRSVNCPTPAQHLDIEGRIGGASIVSFNPALGISAQPFTFGPVLSPPAPAAAFTWTRDGQPLSSANGRITGLNGPALTFSPLTLADVGVYTLRITPGCIEAAPVEATAQLGVRPGCRADFNENGTVGIQDVLDYLAAYFASCP